MKLSLHEYQHTKSLEIKCNIDSMKPQYEIMHWEKVFQILFHSPFTYMAILETIIWNPPLELIFLHGLVHAEALLSWMVLFMRDAEFSVAGELLNGW